MTFQSRHRYLCRSLVPGCFPFGHFGATQLSHRVLAPESGYWFVRPRHQMASNESHKSLGLELFLLRCLTFSYQLGLWRQELLPWQSYLLYQFGMRQVLDWRLSLGERIGVSRVRLNHPCLCRVKGNCLCRVKGNYLCRVKGQVFWAFPWLTVNSCIYCKEQLVRNFWASSLDLHQQRHQIKLMIVCHLTLCYRRSTDYYCWIHNRSGHVQPVFQSLHSSQNLAHWPICIQSVLSILE